MESQSEFVFDGHTYIADHDCVRLTGQWERVFGVMQHGEWLTLHEITRRVGRGSEAGVSARIRDLRKRRFGGYTVERRRRGDPKAGVHEYRLVL